MEDRARVRRGIAMAIVGAMLWGINGTVAGFLMDAYAIDPLWLACVRELLGCWFFLIPAFVLNRDALRDAVSSPRNLLWIYGVGLAAILFSQISYLQAIFWTNPATATVIQSLGILLVLVYTCVSKRRLPLKREAVGIACALVGTYLIATGGRPGQLALPISGAVWGVLLAASSACLAILPRKAMERFGNFAVNGLAFLTSGITLALFVRPWESMPALDLRGILLLAFVIVPGTFGAYGLFLQGAKDAGAMRAALLNTAEPVTATIATVLWLKTSFSVAELVGFALVLAMVFLTTGKEQD